MKNRAENYLILVYTFFMVTIAIANIFLEFEWISTIAKIVFYTILYILTIYICMKASKLDSKIEVLIYIILVATALLNMKTLIFISGIAVVFVCTKYIKSLSKLIIIISTVMLIALSSLFGLVDSELIKATVLDEAHSPNNVYTIEQVRVEANLGGHGVKVSLHKNILSIFDISYRLDLNNEKVDVIWLDDHSFMVDDKLMEVGF